MNKWLLIDGSNLAFRSFYGIAKLSRKDGFATNAIFGWIKTLWRLEDTFTPSKVITFFDISRSHFRQQLFPEYKATRAACPEDLVRQLPFIKEVTRYMGYGIKQEEGIEADDLLASTANILAKKKENVFIVSSDKDLAQCVNSQVSLILPGTCDTLTSYEVCEQFGVEPSQMVDLLSLTGDSSDNIPGLPGVGPKPAAKWLQQYGTIEGIFNSIEGLPQKWAPILNENRQLLERNRALIKLKEDCPIDLTQEDGLQIQELMGFLEKMELKSLIASAQKRFSLLPDTQKDSQQMLLF
ncbi:MAG: hypothetical protein A2007_04340 [Verrucomicrobia bacterium GWC2_42_7]|nr:MAG: hypothetical protein A2007_04340 [Verrucomicrobia bacterium GWC2_42_7]